ncbi:unnamed protein product [Echinostoma caproni]|uniref:S1 motif domain-containing protein n=1 Tax=Echinostoma caproni TaxID=27848 RepID=A0A183ASN0_9TREM|nr:unnamed protein product [Echinostoma caproni]
MENVLWKFVVPLYPVHYNRVTRAIMKYVSSQVNEFVPELSGLLLEYEKKTLRISSCIDISNLHRHSRPQFIVPLRPELPALYIHAQIRVRVFIPRCGLELTATVSALQPHQVFCKTEVDDVLIAVTRCADSGMCEVQSPVDENGANRQTILDLGDVVRVRLSSTTRQLGSFVLRGELLSVISRSTEAPQAVLDKFGSHSSDENDTDKNLEPNVKKPRKVRKTDSVTVKIEESGARLCLTTEPPSPVTQSRKRQLSTSINPEVTESRLAIKIESPESVPTKKKLKTENPKFTAEMFAAFSPQIIRTDSECSTPVCKETKSTKKTNKAEGCQ